jgi:hypothetical protein
MKTITWLLNLFILLTLSRVIFFLVATFHHVATKKCFANDIKDFEMHDFKKSP